MVKKASNPRAFISYSRENSEQANKLYAALTSSGVDAFLDAHEIAVGEEWKARLKALISDCDSFLFMISPSSVRSSVCDWELNESERLGKRMVPLLIEKTEDKDIPGRLLRLNYLDLSSRQHWRENISRLVTELESDIGWVREHGRIMSLTERWLSSGNNNRYLIKKNEISAVESWVSARPESAPELSANQLRFIRLSIEKLQRQRRAIVAASIVVASISSVSLLLQNYSKIESIAMDLGFLINTPKLSRVYSEANDGAGEFLISPLISRSQFSQYVRDTTKLSSFSFSLGGGDLAHQDWVDKAESYAQWISVRTGRRFRLPTVDESVQYYRYGKESVKVDQYSTVAEWVAEDCDWPSNREKLLPICRYQLFLMGRKLLISPYRDLHSPQDIYAFRVVEEL